MPRPRYQRACFHRLPSFAVTVTSRLRHRATSNFLSAALASGTAGQRVGIGSGVCSCGASGSSVGRHQQWAGMEMASLAPDASY